MVEIRWHGRGGQGLVLASRFLAAAALRENLYFQAFPQFGTERMGAPIMAYTRLSDAPINLRCAVYTPDVLIVLDPSLFEAIVVTEGLKEGGILIANYPGPPAEVAATVGADGRFKVYAVDATRISQEELGRPIPNTPMVGALTRVIGLISLDNVLAEFRESFGSRFSPEVTEKNLRALRRAYKEVRGG